MMIPKMKWLISLSTICENDLQVFNLSKKKNILKVQIVSRCVWVRLRNERSVLMIFVFI